jgi:hypothetical protein
LEVVKSSSALFVLLMLAACGSSPESSPAQSPTDREGSAVADATDAGADATELTATSAPLEPGRYTRGSFSPRITLDLTPGWRAVQLFQGFFDVQQQVGSPHVIAVQFADVRGVHGADGPTTTTDPGEAVEILRTNPGLSLVETSESRIGGLTGAQVTVENSGDAHAEVIQVPPGPLGIDPGRRLWVAFFETDDGLLAIMVGGSTERWEEALLTAEPVLESVAIGP